MNSNYKIGDRVVCIDDRNSENLFCGYEYKIVAINQHGNIQVTKGRDGDKPLPHFYKPFRFGVIATEQNTKKNTVKKETKTFDPTKKYKTKGGNEFKFIGMSRDKRYPVLGEFFLDGEWLYGAWCENCNFYVEPEQYQASDFDLVEVADKITINISGIDVTVYDDQSILFGNQATNSLSNDEINAFIDALKMFRD
jgi:hypothetical protein